MNKTFQTLTIRNLDQDEKAEIVEIMNEIAAQNDLSTGQQIFEKGMQERRWYKYKYEAEREQRLTENRDNKNRILTLEEQIAKLQKVVNAWNRFNDAILSL